MLRLLSGLPALRTWQASAAADMGFASSQSLYALRVRVMRSGRHAGEACLGHMVRVYNIGFELVSFGTIGAVRVQGSAFIHKRWLEVFRTECFSETCAASCY